MLSKKDPAGNAAPVINDVLLRDEKLMTDILNAFRDVVAFYSPIFFTICLSSNAYRNFFRAFTVFSVISVVKNKN